jgi:hypothetical protein
MEILDCGWEFRFQCPLKWDRLQKSNDDKIRFCEVCQQSVHLCHSFEEVSRHYQLGHCVAIDRPSKKASPQRTMGLVSIDDLERIREDESPSS